MNARLYVQFDGMNWPNPEAVSEVDYELRYGKPENTSPMYLASICSAYTTLLATSQARRDGIVRGIRAALIEPTE